MIQIVLASEIRVVHVSPSLSLLIQLAEENKLLLLRSNASLKAYENENLKCQCLLDQCVLTLQIIILKIITAASVTFSVLLLLPKAFSHNFANECHHTHGKIQRLCDMDLQFDWFPPFFSHMFSWWQY